MTIDKKARAEILRLHYAEKWKIGTIANQLGVHHITVRRVLADDGVPRHMRRHRRSKLDPFMPFIRQTVNRHSILTPNRRAKLTPLSDTAEVVPVANRGDPRGFV